MIEVSDWVIPLLQALVVAGATYGALRVELRWLRRDTDKNAQAILHCHRRMDDHVERFHTRREERE